MNGRAGKYSAEVGVYRISAKNMIKAGVKEHSLKWENPALNFHFPGIFPSFASLFIVFPGAPNSNLTGTGFYLLLGVLTELLNYRTD